MYLPMPAVLRVPMVVRVAVRGCGRGVRCEPGERFAEREGGTGTEYRDVVVLAWFVSAAACCSHACPGRRWWWARPK